MLIEGEGVVRLGVVDVGIGSELSGHPLEIGAGRDFDSVDVGEFWERAGVGLGGTLDRSPLGSTLSTPFDSIVQLFPLSEKPLGGFRSKESFVAAETEASLNRIEFIPASRSVIREAASPTRDSRCALV